MTKEEAERLYKLYKSGNYSIKCCSCNVTWMGISRNEDLEEIILIEVSERDSYSYHFFEVNEVEVQKLTTIKNWLEEKV